MKDKKNVVFLIIAIIVFLIALIFCLKVYFFNKVNQNETESTEQTEISKTKDIENTSNKDGVIIYKSDGSEVNLSDYKDSPMVLLFFNKDSEDSIEQLKIVEKLYEDYKEKIKFFMINCTQEVDQEIQNDYKLEIFYDFYKGATRSYNVSEFPSIIYINEENQVFNTKTGLSTTDAVQANLDILSNNI